MRRWLRISLSLVSFVLFALATQGENWDAGTALEPLSGFELEGELPDIEGKVTLIDFWASWCSPCKASFQEMDKLYQKYNDQGFQILAISVDQDEKAMRRFLEREKPTFAVARDPKQQLVKSAGIEMMPSSFLVDREGVARSKHQGWHGKRSVKKLEAQIQILLSE